MRVVILSWCLVAPALIEKLLGACIKAARVLFNPFKYVYPYYTESF